MGLDPLCSTFHTTLQTAQVEDDLQLDAADLNDDQVPSEVFGLHVKNLTETHNLPFLYTTHFACLVHSSC